MEISPENVLENLAQVDRVDVTQSAVFREAAIDVLADPKVSQDWREAIADRLNEANLELTIHSVDDEIEDESY
jgi:hypothetical protein